MLKNLSAEMKVGLFALICLVIVAFGTLRLSDRSIIAGGAYKMTIIMDTAIGIKAKTPVEIAGIQIGIVKKVKLDNKRKAHVTLLLTDGIKLPEGTVAFVRAKGFLGQTYIELRPPAEDVGAFLKQESNIDYGGVSGDMNLLMSQFNDIGRDIKGVTSSLKTMIGSDDSSPVYRTVQNLDKFTEALQKITLNNEANMNRIINNLAILTDDLRASRHEIQNTVANLSSITGKVDAGEGTIGKLVNDETTVNKLNEAADSMTEALGSLRRWETQIGYHLEYLGGTNDYKNYVHLNFLPRPDEGILFEFVTDPAPPVEDTLTNTTITAGGTSSMVQTLSQVQKRDKFLVSAQLAKKFYDFRFRGGIIESSGGVGVDYIKSPIKLSFQAYDFDTKYQRKPHLKAWGTWQVTKSLYLLGGADDFIAPNQPANWFVGAGIRLVDDDIKGILGLASKGVK